MNVIDVILRVLPVLACPLIMGGALWFMMRGQNGNGNKSNDTQQAPGSWGQVRQVVLSNEQLKSAPARHNSVLSMLTMCLNPKVLAGLAVVGVGLLVFAPNLALGALPVLALLACPLSMLFMMRGMKGMNHNGANGAQMAGCADCDPAPQQTQQPIVIDQIPSAKSDRLLTGDTGIKLPQARQSTTVASQHYEG